MNNGHGHLPTLRDLSRAAIVGFKNRECLVRPSFMNMKHEASEASWGGDVTGPINQNNLCLHAALLQWDMKNVTRPPLRHPFTVYSDYWIV